MKYMRRNILCFKTALSTACFLSTDAAFILQDTPNIVPRTTLGGIVGWYLS